MEVEEGEHGELDGRVRGPVGIGFGDRHDVDGVQKKFHTEEGEEEADGVQGCSAKG